MIMMKIAVPTTTILAMHPEDKFKIAVLRSGTKFKGKLILPGGCVKVGVHDCLQTGVIELKEEAGLTLMKGHLFCISSKPGRDVRHVAIEEWADGNPFPPRLAGVAVETHHCFDVAIYGVAKGEPVADGREGVEAFWYNLRALDESAFALDHGKLASLFKEFLLGAPLPPLGVL